MQRRMFVLAAFGALVAPPASAQLARLTQGDAARGVKEALTLASTLATQRLGQRDGFFGDARVRIPLPSTLARAQRSLSPLGLAGPLDDLQLRMNRGAEAAMPAARRLLVDAVRGITVQDAIGIVSGGDNAATAFLRQRTEPQLTTALTPPMQNALNGAGAFTALDRVASSPSLSAFGVNSASLRTQVVSFAVTKGLDGAFSYIAEEERGIRRDPVRRSSDLLRRVFGA